MAFKKQTYKDYVVNDIYERLLKGELAAGSQVLESAVAQGLGISRAPVREALTALVGEGLLEYRPQVGHFVPSLSPEEIVDAYVTRGVLEGFAARSSLELFSKAELDELVAMTYQMEADAGEEKHKELIDVGDVFHRQLFCKCRNQQIVEFTERLSHKLHLLFYRYWPSLYSPAEVGERHRRLLAPLQAGDPDGVERVIRAHYTESGEKIAALHKGQ